MNILKSVALILFVILSCGFLAIFGFQMGYEKALHDCVEQFEAVYAKGVQDGYSAGIEAKEESDKKFKL